MNIISRQLKRAKTDGRVCSRCGWIITVKNWKKGFRLCAGCYDALKGVNVRGGHWAAADEARDRTGDMI